MAMTMSEAEAREAEPSDSTVAPWTGGLLELLGFRKKRERAEPRGGLW